MGMLGLIRKRLQEGRSLLVFSAVTMTDRALGVVLPLVVAKWFAPGLFGSYSLARMIVFAIAALTMSSAQPAFIVQAGRELRDGGAIRRTFSSQCLFLVLSIVLFLPALLLLRGQVAAFAGISVAEVALVSLAFVGLSLKTFLGNLLLALGRRSTSALVDLAYNVLTLGLLAACHFTWGVDIRSVFLVYFLAACGVSVLFLPAIPLPMLLPFEFDRAAVREMLSVTKWMVLGSAAAYLVDWGDNVVLRLYVSMGDIGTYNVAYPLFKGTLFLAGGVNQYFLPFLCEHIADKEKLRAFLNRKRPVVLLMGLAAIGLLFLLAPAMIRAIYGQKYAEAGLALRILLAGGALNLYTVFQGTLCYAFGRHRAWQLITVAQLVANLALDFLLAPRMGILGTAVATVIAYLLKAVLMEVYFRLRVRRLVFS
jgi:O-antigen/teichoic acid export membrane protein